LGCKGISLKPWVLYSQGASAQSSGVGASVGLFLFFQAQDARSVTIDDLIISAEGTNIRFGNTSSRSIDLRFGRQRLNVAYLGNPSYVSDAFVYENYASEAKTIPANTIALSNQLYIQLIFTQTQAGYHTGHIIYTMNDITNGRMYLIHYFTNTAINFTRIV
jgi:hypothetical protein